MDKRDRTEYFKEYRKKNPDKSRKAIHKSWRKKIIRELIIEGIIKEEILTQEDVSQETK